MAARLSSRFTRFYRNITTSSTSNHLRWNCTTNSTNLTRKLARTSTIPPPRTKPAHSFRHPQTSTQASLRRFSTSRTFLQRKYVRFQVDPEAPLDYRRWNPGTQVAVGLVVMGASYYFYHLEQVPETGRWRFMDVNPKYEALLAKTAHSELLSEFQGKILPPNHPLTKHIRRVVATILEANDLGKLQDHDEVGHAPQGLLSRVFSPHPNGTVSPNDTGNDNWNPDSSRPNVEISSENVKNTREWNLLVVNDDKMANAMATYGNIIVFTGILPICGDEQGLAAVLGHEIGHVVARHASEKYSSIKIFMGVAMLLQLIGLDFGLARIATTLLLELPNSRKMEFEADKIGLHLASKACYDPQAAVEMQTRLAQMERKMGRLNIDFIYTHPTGQKRINYIQSLLPEAYSVRAASPGCESVRDSYDSFRAVMPSFL